MQRVKSPVIAGVAALGLAITTAGCASDGGYAIDKRTIGTAVGAAAGAGIGTAFGQGGGKTAAIIAGGVLGALVGSEIGRQLDERDRELAYSTTNDALERYPSGSTAEWKNPDSGNYGTVSAEPAYRDPAGQVCREYTQTITIDGRGETATGVACRQPDGTWRIVNS
ncbi:MAG: glycine zipper 2TM domain-containing protein [Rhodobacteraceae bacterium]|nr:glycine zipper 2TM domain-containing protein [Paracoccaceae bacterium]